MMDLTLKNSIRNGLWGIVVGIVFGLLSGIIDFVSGFVVFSFVNLLWTLGGVLIIGIMFFSPIFMISLIVYYFKHKNE